MIEQLKLKILQRFQSDMRQNAHKRLMALEAKPEFYSNLMTTLAFDEATAYRFDGAKSLYQGISLWAAGDPGVARARQVTGAFLTKVCAMNSADELMQVLNIGFQVLDFGADLMDVLNYYDGFIAQLESRVRAKALEIRGNARFSVSSLLEATSRQTTADVARFMRELYSPHTFHGAVIGGNSKHDAPLYLCRNGQVFNVKYDSGRSQWRREVLFWRGHDCAGCVCGRIGLFIIRRIRVERSAAPRKLTYSRILCISKRVVFIMTQNVFHCTHMKN